MGERDHGSLAYILGIVFLLLLVVIVSIGAVRYDSYLNTPPSVDAVEAKFQENRAEILTVVEYMTSSGYDNIYITDGSGTIQADFVDLRVDETVGACIKNLVDRERYVSINKIGNTIWFLQWRGVRDIGCGVAYTIDNFEITESKYLNRIVPLQNDCWYYYISD